MLFPKLDGSGNWLRKEHQQFRCLLENCRDTFYVGKSLFSSFSWIHLLLVYSTRSLMLQLIKIICCCCFFLKYCLLGVSLLVPFLFFVFLFFVCLFVCFLNLCQEIFASLFIYFLELGRFCYWYVK